MATRTTTSDFTNATDAQFRAWGKWFRDCFSAAGWVLVGEVFNTGSDWTTVTTPSTTNQSRVEPIFRMDDALQSTAPLYIKLFIGSCSTTTNPGYRFIIGTGVSGSTITGVLEDTGTNHLVHTATTQIMTHYSSGSTSRIMISMCHSGISWSVGQQLVLCIERRKDGTGADQATGFLVNWSQNSAKVSRGHLASAVGPAARANWYTLAWSSPAVFDGKANAGPVVYDMGVLEMGLQMGSAMTTEYSVGATFSVTVLGSAHTYIQSQIIVAAIDGASGNNSHRFLYE